MRLSEAVQSAPLINIRVSGGRGPAGGTAPVDTDGTLAANSDGVVPSQKAVKTYVDGAVAGTGDLLASNNLSDLASATAARSNLGLAIGTDVQAYDAGLASIAAASTTGKLYYLSATDTWSAVTIGSGLNFSAGTLSATGGGGGGGDLLSTNNLSDLASASAARTNLGLVIGTNVQAYDAELSAIAGLTSAANKLPYFTGSGTAALADLSAAGRALIDDADAAAQRTTLGIDKQNLALPLTFNFTAAGDAYFYADEAMTLTQQATVGTGTIAYAKGTTAAPTTFSSTTSPISLQAGAWLKVSASSVTGGVAVHLKRTA